MAEKKIEENLSKETKENKKQPDLNDFVIKEKTTILEIRWAFKTAMSHYSYNSSRILKSLLKLCFRMNFHASRLSLYSTSIKENVKT